MDQARLATVFSGIFADLPKTYDEVKYALEGDGSFTPPRTVVRKVLIDFAREVGKASSGYMIQQAFDEEPDFTRDLALAAAASYAKKPR
jgi:hypothetical protein